MLKGLFALRINYGSLAIPIAMLGLPVYIYLPSYYAAQFSMGLASIGSALFLARLFDVVTDPLIGHWSDRLCPHISRKQQIIAATVLLLFFLSWLFLPQLWLGDKQVTWLQLFIVSFFSYLAWTMVQIPYLAMAAEVDVEGNHESLLQQRQNPLVSSREAMTILGILVMLLLPLILSTAVTDSEFYVQFIMILGILFLLSVLLLTRLPTNTGHITQTEASSTLIKQWRLLRTKHPHALVILTPYFINNLANAIPATLFLIFVEDFLQLKEDAGIFLLVYFLAGLIALPIWSKLANRFGSMRIWRLSILISVLSFSLVFILESGDYHLYLLICVLTGLSLTIDIAIPASIQTSISQEIEKKSANMHGVLFGIWGMTTKLSLAMAVGLSLPLLEWLVSTGITEEISLLALYALPAILLKLWVWTMLPKLSQKLP